jgi:hypothetical protein
VNSTIQRILAAEGKIDVTQARLHLLLLHEFFRRMLLWAKELDCLDEWPYIDVAAHIDSSIRAISDEIKEFQDSFRDSEMGGHRTMEKTLCLAIHWAALKDKHPVLESILPDPYEPIIVMYEHGGLFYHEHGHAIDVTYVTGMLRQGWRFYDGRAPFVELDGSLDQEDSALDKT